MVDCSCLDFKCMVDYNVVYVCLECYDGFFFCIMGGVNFIYFEVVGYDYFFKFEILVKDLNCF